MTVTGWLRLKRFLAVHGWTVVALLVLLGGASFSAAAWVDQNPETETVVETTDSQTIETNAGTSALVTKNTTLWDRGTRLHNRSLYLFDASPHLRLRLQTAVPDGDSGKIGHDVSLVYRASHDGETFWTRSESLLDGRNVTGTSHVSQVRFNASRIHKKAQTLEREIQGAASVSVAVRVTTHYQTDQYAGQLNASAPLVFTSGGYSLGDSLTQSTTHTTEMSHEEPVPSQSTTLLGLVFGGFLSLGLAGGVGAYVRRDPDVDQLESRLEQTAYAEWISNGRLPFSRDDLQTGWEFRYVELLTLPDLVNLGIDNQIRTVYDDEADLYAVVDGEVVYYLDPESDRSVPEPGVSPAGSATEPPAAAQNGDSASVGATEDGALSWLDESQGTTEEALFESDGETPPVDANRGVMQEDDDSVIEDATSADDGTERANSDD